MYINIYRYHYINNYINNYRYLYHGIYIYHYIHKYIYIYMSYRYIKVRCSLGAENIGSIYHMFGPVEAPSLGALEVLECKS